MWPSDVFGESSRFGNHGSIADRLLQTALMYIPWVVSMSRRLAIRHCVNAAASVQSNAQWVKICDLPLPFSIYQIIFWTVWSLSLLFCVYICCWLVVVCCWLVSSGGVCSVLPQESGEDGSVWGKEGTQETLPGGGQSCQGQLTYTLSCDEVKWLHFSGHLISFMKNQDSASCHAVRSVNFFYDA